MNPKIQTVQDLNGLACVSHYMARITSLCRPEPLAGPLATNQIQAVENGAEKFSSEFLSLPGDIREAHKSIVETAIRGCFWNELNQRKNFVELEWLIRFTIGCVDADILDPAVPYVLFQEACDWGDSREKEQIANLFVDLKDKWRSLKFTSNATCRNMLLRFAVELLSRLSKTTSAKARGRLLCYVSARIPMSDKGAANIAGEFNAGRCPTTEGLTAGTGINTHSSGKFAHMCNLLDYLKNPNLVLTEKGFAAFKQGIESILEMMTPTDMKEGEQEEGEVEDGRSKILTRMSKGYSADGIEVNLSSIRYIPDPGMLESDMKQDRIKRNLLCRFLFVAQYICLPSKPKGPYEPTEEQLLWCEKKVQIALEILSRTSPDGPLYVQRLLDHLENEAKLSIWKDNQCPPLQSAPRADLSSLSPVPLPNQLPYAKVTRIQYGKEKMVQRKPIRDMILSGPGKVTGSAEVTRLLNKGPNTTEEFENLGYQPPPLIYFAPVVEQAITKETPKIVNDEKFQWRALRILGKRTHIHFSNEAAVDKMPIKDMGPFLENYVLQLAERNPDLQAVKQSYLAASLASPPELPATNIEENGAADLGNDNLDDLMNPCIPDEELPTEEEPEPTNHQSMNKDNILRIAKLISADWERFAKILKFDPDSVAYWKSSNEDPVQQAALMLQVYTEQHTQPDSDSNEALEKLLGMIKDEFGLDL